MNQLRDMATRLAAVTDHDCWRWVKETAQLCHDAADAINRALGVGNMTVKTYDTKTYELAEYFLTDEPGVTEFERHELALVIQDTIESWIQFRRSEKFPDPGPEPF